MRSLAASLRGDHVAIAMAPIESRDTATRTLTVSGDRHLAGGAIRVLGVADFLEVGSGQLKERFLRCMLTPEVEYNVHGLSLPPMCHGHHGRALITKIMEANAVPGHDVFYVNDKVREVIADIDAIIRHFQAAGIIHDGAVEGTIQMSTFGMDYIRCSRRCNDFVRFFSRRVMLPITEWTQWEMLDALFEAGWQLDVPPQEFGIGTQLPSVFELAGQVEDARSCLVLFVCYR